MGSYEMVLSLEYFKDKELPRFPGFQVFPDHPGDCCRSRALCDRRESGVSTRVSTSREGDRRSVATRKSYADRDDAGDVRQSVAYRKSYVSRDDEGDVRQSVAYRKSYASRDDEGRNGHGDVRSSLASRKSYDVADEGEFRPRRSTSRDDGDVRKSLSRKSYDEGDLRRSVADRASSYSRAVDEGKVILSGAVRDLRRSVADRASSYSRVVDEGDLRRSVADRASSYSRVVDEGKVIKSGAVSFGFFEVRHGC
eukprot:symbB.v1.2.013387.t4/scaffold948.1/size149721/3